MNVFTNLDLNFNKLMNARLDPRFSDPPLNRLAKGSIWFNENENVFKYYDGEEIKTFQTALDFLTIQDIDIIWDTAQGS